jgi:hypothetical protein
VRCLSGHELFSAASDLFLGDIFLNSVMTSKCMDCKNLTNCLNNVLSDIVAL